MVGNSVTCAGRADGDVARCHSDGLTVVIIFCSSLHNIEELAVLFVDMPADAASRLQGDFREQAAFVVQLFGSGNKVGDFHGAFPVPHVFPVFNTTFISASDHLLILSLSKR